MAKVYGCWEFTRRPEVTDEQFEQAARAWVAQPIEAGWRMVFAKADRGARIGKYLMLFEVDSVEVRDAFFSEEGVTPAAEQWFAANPQWVAAQEAVFALSLDMTGTDYAVFAAQ